MADKVYHSIFQTLTVLQLKARELGLDDWSRTPRVTSLHYYKIIEYINNINPKTRKMSDESVTAVDFLEQQLELEKQARELMPYEPDVCTYPTPFRQIVFACLTCSRADGGSNVAVCYLCLIQCHSTHELVELFSKRNIVCDCGTTRMSKGTACAIRSKPAPKVAAGLPRMRSGSASESARPFKSIELPPATDIESLGNTYNHNYQGRFCSCGELYNPLKESRTMHQCYFGEACGEDWFHQDCILGYKQGLFGRATFAGSGQNRLDDLAPPGEDAELEAKARKDPEDNEYEVTIPHFPELDSFSEFICWKCTSQYPEAFEELSQMHDIVSHKMSHFENVGSPQDYDSLQNSSSVRKRIKTESGPVSTTNAPYSLFLTNDFKKNLKSKQQTLNEDSPLARLLKNFEFLTAEDPIYQPPEDANGSSTSSTASLYDLGSTALLSLAVPHALQGLQAYDTMKEKLRGLFKGFVEQDKPVTEEAVREFFGKMQKEN